MMIDVVIDGKWTYCVDEDFLNVFNFDSEWLNNTRLINEISTAI